MTKRLAFRFLLALAWLVLAADRADAGWPATGCPDCDAHSDVRHVSHVAQADYICASCWRPVALSGPSASVELSTRAVRPASFLEADHSGVRLASASDPVPATAYATGQYSRRWEVANLFTGQVFDTHVEPLDRFDYDPFFYRPFWQFTGEMYEDTLQFFSPRSLAWLGISLGGAAILANTSMDENFRNWFQDNVRDGHPDTHWAKEFGEPWIPAAIAITWGITEFVETNPAGGGPVNGALRDWSRQSMRAFLLAGVPVYGLQWITGASRPGEDPSKGSSWKPFDDNNGVSGHAALGAIPFLVAAKQTDSLLLKSALYFGSGLAGYSRIYDDAHYLSQVLLGYAIAYVAVEATFATNDSGSSFRVVPLTLGGTYGFAVETTW